MARITIGLLNETSTIPDELVKRVAAALQVQVQRDVKPIWEVDADVVALPRTNEVPSGVWPVILFDPDPKLPAGAHYTVAGGVPMAEVTNKRDWILAASHETVEMLVDPTGAATRPSRGLSLANGAPVDTEETFHYLIEACDPIEDTDHAYHIDNLPMADFYTPQYFDAVAASGVRYSFNGGITRPREVGRNGYLSWHDPAGKLRQLRNFGKFEIVDLPDDKAAGETTRMFVDRNTRTPRTHPELFNR